MALTITIGIAGAGVWAERVHIPSVLADPRFRISGIWARRRDQVERISERWGIPPIFSFDDLVRRSDVVDFAVPPAAQAPLALEAATQGKHLILEKPVGTDPEVLGRLEAEVRARGVTVGVFVTRFFDEKRVELIQNLGKETWTRARSVWRSGAYLPGSAFASHWRDPGAILYDIGPHSISQLEAILGKTESGIITGHTRTTADIRLNHEGGAVSDLCIDVGAQVDLEEELTLYGTGAPFQAILPAVDPNAAFRTLLDRLANDLELAAGGGRIYPREVTLAEGIRMVRVIRDLVSSNGSQEGAVLSGT